MSGQTVEPVLDAAAVFSELVALFKPGDLPLTKDPLGFFAQHLRESLLILDDETIPDPYAFGSVIEERLEAFRNAVRSAQPREAIGLAGKLPLDGLSQDQLREVLGLVAELPVALLDDSVEEIAEYDLTVAVGDKLRPTALSDSRIVARALFNKSFRLGALGRSAEEIAVYDEVLRRFGDATELALREQVAKARLNRDLVLKKMGG